MSSEGIMLLIGAYLFGSIPTGVIVSRFIGSKDIRREGSGNIGATNVYRVLGVLPGIFTLMGDVVKGMVPVVAARSLLGHDSLIAVVAFITFLRFSSASLSRTPAAHSNVTIGCGRWTRRKPPVGIRWLRLCSQ